ncbi:glycosyltransferase family 2 protein [Stagnihabitans tardus]|uniref:Glycosyltransferase n=1 Tax=Stagnihabitans tardus TaxID=2699202 RepID=A0AAE4YC79_9RHOB|nr:glycosyltransferase family 2 protein [Stagnihabitans tardus]NBZ90042.1 glycosyltransferase [Stagnihabitans tardus]
MSKDAHPGPAPVPPPLPADVVAIVVNYGTAELALLAVESLLDHPDRLAGVHLVDNASPGEDGQRLAEAIAARGWGSRVTFRAETVNHGFGRGNNLVIDRLLAGEGAGRKVFLLNPDARVEGAAVARMADFLDSHPEAGAVGARIRKPGADGIARPVTAAFRFPSLVSVFSDAVSFGPLARLCARWQVPLPAEMATGRVDWVAGAAVMFRLEALAEVGGFDPDFFLYYEEVELMHRLGRAGWQTWYLAEAEVLHAEGAATGVKSGEAPRRRPAYWYRSWALYMVKTRGRAGALLATGLWLLGAGVNVGLSALRGRKAHLAPRFFADVRTHVLVPLLRGRNLG